MGDLARVLGRPLFGWQQAVVDVALERGRQRYRYPLVTVSVPRQSGKTTLGHLVAVHRCLSVPDGQVWYTAQSRQDAILRWRELVRLLRRSPLVELPPWERLKAAGAWDFRVRATTGEETVEFRNGGQLRVFAPSEDSLHGSVTDLVIIDEARFFDERQGNALMGAVLPTQATRDGQVWITSTAGGPSSTFLHRELAAGRAALQSTRARRAHAEWGIGGDVAEGELLEAVWAAHPSAGLPGGISRDALSVFADERPAWQFAHEFGNRWRTAEDERLLPVSAWDRARTEQPIGDGVPCFGVDVDPDRAGAAIVACVAGVCQLVEYHEGVSWVVDRARDLAARWEGSRVWVDAAGPAGSVAAALRDGGMGDTLVVTSARELAAACGSFYDALMSDPPEVCYRPNPVLDEAARRAARRPLSQAWVFDRIASGPALIALVLAWAADRRRTTAEAAVEPLEAPAVFV